LQIAAKGAEQEAEIADLETNYYNNDNSELKRAEAIKQRGLAKRSNELAVEKAIADREAGLAELEATHYGKAAERVCLNEMTMQNAVKARREYELKKVVLAEQERLEAAKRELAEVKAVGDEKTIKTRNTKLNEIAAERAQIEQNTAQYWTIQRARDNILVSMQESAMSAAKTPDDDFIQSVCNEMAAQADRTNQFEMQIRKHKMLTEGIETQQRLIGQQLVNQRTEEAILLQNANFQLQKYPTQIQELEQLAQQHQGAITSGSIQGAQEIISLQTKIEELLQYIEVLTQQHSITFQQFYITTT
jgi:hypothetical protein